MKKNYSVRKNSIPVLVVGRVSRFAGSALAVFRYATVVWKRIYGDLPVAELVGTARIAGQQGLIDYHHNGVIMPKFGYKIKKNHFTPFCFFIVISVFISLLSCTHVPLTNRKGIHLLPPTQMYTMGLQQYSKIIKESEISKDNMKVAQLRSVGERVAKAAENFMKDSGMGDQLKYFKWEFNLIEDEKTVNAWCMPGGKVAVYTGILPITKDETGLAVVVGHEVAHAIAGHGNERMSQSLIVSMGGLALSVAISEKPEKTQDLFLSAFGMAANVGFLLPYSRVHESEADRIGLMLMARAGYDPHGAIPFWKRMNEKAGPNPPEFLSTHPVPETRISQIRSFLPEVIPYYEKARKKY